MPWIFSEETGCFSSCPLTSISFSTLHPLFPFQKPFLQNTPSPVQHTFSFSPSFSLSLTAQLSTHALTSLLTPTQFSHFLILSFSSSFSVFLAESLFFSLLLHAIWACHHSNCSPTLLSVCGCFQRGTSHSIVSQGLIHVCVALKIQTTTESEHTQLHNFV